MKNFILFLLCLYFSNLYAYGVIDKDFSNNNIGNIHEGHNEIILTFDDGPTRGVTNLILDILQDYNIKATFFVIGKNVKANPELMNRILTEGHIVGNHSMTHTALKKLDPIFWDKKVKSEVLDAHEVIFPYMGNNNQFFFRAPEAAWAQKYASFLNLDPIGRKYIGPILWDIGGEIEYRNGKYLQAADWACWSKKISIKDCMSGYINEARRRKGGVVLMHDLRRQSVEMLAKMIPVLQDEGFIFTNLNDVSWKL